MKEWFTRWLAQFKKPESKTRRQQSYKAGINMEACALRYLKKQGLKHKDSNFCIRGAEIDLIMQEVDTLVFVEVKYRASSEYGAAKETITASKQQKIRKAAEFYLKKHYQSSWPDCRFDAVCIDGDEANVEWIKNAF